MASKRFATNTSEEIDEKRKCLANKNTEKSNKFAARLFRSYLQERKVEDDQFEIFPDDKLDGHLQSFYFNARTAKENNCYKSSTLENFRFGLNRYLKAPPFNRVIDLKGVNFIKSNECYKSALRELKLQGKGSVDHYPRISDADLAAIYNSTLFDTSTPTGLLNKVQFDVRFYFARRGSENVHAMTKSTYEIITDSDTGKKYVAQKTDELNKNHKEMDRERYTGFMPEFPGDPKCPVSSFSALISHLNPTCDRLWQKPKMEITKEEKVWFFNRPIGEVTLSSFMPKLSSALGLQKYTNHSIRVTGATILTQGNFGVQQIMAVTGHKSVNSLATYHRISDAEKMAMGNVLGTALGIREPTRPLATVSTETTDQDDGADADLPVMVPNFELNLDLSASLDENDPSLSSSQTEERTITIDTAQSVSTATVKKTCTRTGAAGMIPHFSGCSIKNININYNFH